MWQTFAYGQYFTAYTFETLVAKVDQYGERHSLRAVSIVADYIGDNA